LRKLGDVGNLNFCTFTQVRNGLIGWSFDIPAYAYCQTLGAREKKNKTADNLLLRDRENKMKIMNNEQPTHKTAHLQIAQADTRPKFAKELFSCQRSRWNY